MTLHSTKN